MSLEIDFPQKQLLRFHIHWVGITVERNGQWIIFDQPMLYLETLQCQPAVQATQPCYCFAVKSKHEIEHSF